MNKIQRTSRIFRRVLLTAVCLLPLFAVLHWFFGATLPSQISFEWARKYGDSDHIPALSDLKYHIRVICFAITMIPIGIQMLAFGYAMQLCRLYERLTIFSSENVRYYKKIGITLLIGQLLYPVYEALITFSLTFYNAPGERFISLSIGSSNIAMIMIAVVFIFMSWVMGEGAKLEEEQHYTV